MSRVAAAAALVVLLLAGAAVADDRLARIVIDGKVFEPGAAVLADVFLEAVLPDRVVFRTALDQRVELRL